MDDDGICKTTLTVVWFFVITSHLWNIIWYTRTIKMSRCSIYQGCNEYSSTAG